MRTWLLTLALAAGIGTAPVIADSGSKSAVACHSTLATAASPDTRPTAEMYAQREARSRDLEDFTGGRRQAVGIGVVVLVVLLVLLLI